MIDQDALDRIRRRANQYAVAGSGGAAGGYAMLESLHATAVYYFPGAPESLWQFLGLLISALMGGGLGRVVRGLE